MFSLSDPTDKRQYKYNEKVSKQEGKNQWGRQVWDEPLDSNANAPGCMARTCL
jgi:hypothetical protein